jgi:predicted ribosome quality control (RQC) complex YloA/Tae2 family protein
MRILLDISQSAQQNAQRLFEEAKRLKEKAKGTDAGILLVEKKLKELETKSQKAKPKSPEKRKAKEWFEKFRWCITRNGFLCVGGKDAHSNEAVIKHHMDENDWYFHADVFGAPHCVLKTDGKKPSPSDFEDAAAFAGVFSSVWKKGLFSVRVYKVSPSQVSKKAPAGESLGKGAFMIYGEREWFDPDLRLGWGIQEVKNGFRVLCGPLRCIKVHSKFVMEIVPGTHSKSDVAKSYQRGLAKKDPPISLSLDELIAALPTGEFSLKPI